MNETLIKYLAGLLDADGCFSFEYTGNKLHLRLQVSAATSIDRHGFVLSLPELTGMGTSHQKSQRGNWAPVTMWVVSTRKEVEMLVPRLLKHLVIKGKHLSRMYLKWQEMRDRRLTDIEMEQLRVFSKASRADAGPLRAKKHPTWAWVAGYLDGDGSYMFSSPPSHKGRERLLIQATAHINDRVGLDLLQKAFGGSIYDRGAAAPHILDWKHSLNKREASFAIKFLTKMVQHSKLKKHKIEQMLAYHNCLSTGLAQTN